MKPGVWGGLQVGSIGLGIVQVFTWHPKTNWLPWVLSFIVSLGLLIREGGSVAEWLEH